MHFNEVRLIYPCFEIRAKYVDDDDGDDCGIDVNERVCVFSAAVGIVGLLLTRRVNYTNKGARVAAGKFFFYLVQLTLFGLVLPTRFVLLSKVSQLEKT